MNLTFYATQEDVVGQTAAHAAIDRKQHKLVQLLVNNGTSPDSVDFNGQTIVAQACVMNDIETVRFELELESWLGCD